MSARWLVNKREHAMRDWLAIPEGNSDKAPARRRLRFWDTLLDLRTLNGRI